MGMARFRSGHSLTSEAVESALVSSLPAWQATAAVYRSHPKEPHPHMNDFTPEDPIPALLAEIDQVLALAPQLARVAYGNYQAFIGAGFQDKQALYLTAVQLQSTPGTPPA